MRDEDTVTLKQLAEARDNIQRQIDLTLTGEPYSDATNRDIQVASILRTLRAQLREINEIIADMEASDAQGSE
jgi:hypothetical protein